MNMNYREAAAFLDGLQYFKIKLGLESIRQFLAELGNPQEGLKFLHIGGTNGKGSVAANLLAILSRAGYKTGLFTSPHLSSVRERFRINDRFMPESEFARHAASIKNILRGRQITYFECTTALALLWFAHEKVDIAIMEVGMGGRLDATNVITPLVSVITNVSMDHEIHLGDTLEKIAGEKAGIIKPGVPVISGAADGVPRMVIEKACLERNAPLYLLGRDFAAIAGEGGQWTYEGLENKYTGLQCGLFGAYQIGNAAQALAVLELLGKRDVPVSGNAVRQGLSQVRWPGRLEMVTVPERAPSVPSGYEPLNKWAAGKRFLLDGAHNPAGVAGLVDALRSGPPFRNLILVWAGMADKDLAGMLSQIIPHASAVVLTRPNGERTASPERLKQEMPPDSVSKSHCVPDVGEALIKAAELAGKEDLVCVAGSLYLVGAARKLLLGELVGG